MGETAAELNIHPPVDSIPDHDWKGETWGLYWPDLEEFNELMVEASEKKHYEDKRKKYPPADGVCQIRTVETQSCPKEKTPVPVSPKVVLREEKKTPAPAPEVFQKNRRDPGKWDWVRNKESSAQRARFSLSVYW